MAAISKLLTMRLGYQDLRVWEQEAVVGREQGQQGQQQMQVQRSVGPPLGDFLEQLLRHLEPALPQPPPPLVPPEGKRRRQQQRVGNRHQQRQHPQRQQQQERRQPMAVDPMLVEQLRRRLVATW